MSRSTTVARLLGRTFGALVLLILLSGSAGVAAAGLQYRSVEALTEQVLPLQMTNAQLRTVLGDAQRGLRGYLLTGDSRFLDTYRSALRRYPAVEQSLREQAEAADLAAVDVQRQRADAWWALARQQRAASPRSDLAAQYAEQGRALFDEFVAANDALDVELTRRGDALRAESGRLRALVTVLLLAVTGLAGLLAAVAATQATRRITRPLSGLVTVLDHLRAGEREARACPSHGPTEIQAVAAAVNTLADQADRLRRAEQEYRRLSRAGRELAVRIRHHLAVQDALREAATGLSEILAAEHVVIRLVGVGDAAPTVVWRSRPGATGDPTALTAVPLDWLTDGEVRVLTDLDTADLPTAEREALRAAGAGAAVTAGVGAEEQRLGAVTLIRAADRPAWTAAEIRVLESVAADLGRGIRHARLYEQEQRLVARLQELDTVKTDFMSTVSHELRTPLTSIAGYVEMLRDEDAGPVSAGQAKMLEVIGRNTDRLRALIEDLLILSRIEAGTFRSHRQRVELCGLVEAVRAAVQPAAERGDVRLTTQVNDRLELTADPDQLDRVLMNLVSNAVKFTPPGGQVRIEARRAPGEALLVVSDTGMGIPEQERERLFTRFFRASNAVRQAVPGTGLGLAIVHTIVDNHHGRVEVESAEGVGTTVTVRLPLG